MGTARLKMMGNIGPYDKQFSITQTDGYIKLATTHKAFEVFISLYDIESHDSHFRIYCNDVGSHGHRVYVDATSDSEYYGLVPTHTNGLGYLPCEYYIPIKTPNGFDSCTIYVKGINTYLDDITCEFVTDVGSAYEITPTRLDKYNETIGDIETALRILNEGV